MLYSATPAIDARGARGDVVRRHEDVFAVAVAPLHRRQRVKRVAFAVERAADRARAKA